MYTLSDPYSGGALTGSRERKKEGGVSQTPPSFRWAMNVGCALGAVSCACVCDLWLGIPSA